MVEVLTQRTGLTNVYASPTLPLRCTLQVKMCRVEDGREKRLKWAKTEFKGEAASLSLLQCKICHNMHEFQPNWISDFGGSVKTSPSPFHTCRGLTLVHHHPTAACLALCSLSSVGKVAAGLNRHLSPTPSTGSCAIEQSDLSDSPSA